MSIKINFDQFKETLVDLPFFVFRDKKVENLNLISKLLFLIKSKFIILIYKSFNKNLYCFFMNLFYKKDGKTKEKGPSVFGVEFKDVPKKLKEIYIDKVDTNKIESEEIKGKVNNKLDKLRALRKNGS